MRLAEASSEPVTPSQERTSHIHTNTKLRPYSSIRDLATKRSLPLRVRPSFSHERPENSSSPTMKDPPSTAAQPALSQRRSNMSLFHLFSKPKVEKARGYGGEGASPTAPAVTTPPVETTSKPSNAQTLAPPKDTTTRPTSALSFRQRIVDPQPPKQKPVDTGKAQKPRKTGEWTPPPLFQAFPRSTAHGLVQVAHNASDKIAVTKPTRPYRARDSFFADPQPRISGESLGSEEAKSTKVGPNNTAAGGTPNPSSDIPRRIVVLLESGHLLQYHEHGPTDRLPEKSLQLGPDSAAYASDDIAGRPYVIRVIQVVTPKSSSLSTSVARLSKFARRTVGSKREISSVFLVLQDKDEMANWLFALRRRIERAGRPATSVGNQHQWFAHLEVVEEHKKPEEPAVTPSAHAQSGSNLLPAVTTPSNEPPDSLGKDGESDDDGKGSLELVEEEAQKLAPEIEVFAGSGRDKRISEALSFTSSKAPSVDQQALNNLRSSVRTSHASNMTDVTSRTNSFSEAPSNKASIDSSGDNASLRSPYRILSSYSSIKRRSAMPMPTTKETQPPAETTTSPSSPQPPTQTSVGDESPITGPNSPTPTPSMTFGTRSPPLITRSASDANVVEDLPVDPTPPIAEEEERPQSFVADLPPPSTWATKLSPKKRISMSPSDVADKAMQRISSAPALSAMRTSTQSQPKSSRRASQPFRLPLKINPDIPANRPPSRSNNRNSFAPEPQQGPAQVHTLEAKIDPLDRRRSVSQPNGGLQSRPSQRLSLFPSPLLAQNTFPESRKRSPSLTVPQSPTVETDTRRASLKRPTSLQVRNSPAPFLSSVRSPGAPPVPGDRTSSLQASARTTPIRSLKASRSTSSMPPMQPLPEDKRPVIKPSPEQNRPASPTDPFTARRSSALRMLDERPHTQLQSLTPPPPSNPPPPVPISHMNNSFAQQKVLAHRSLQIRSSMVATLPSLDLGLPVVGLGPPAPPPTMPLPAPPPGAPPGLSRRSITPLYGLPIRPLTAAPTTPPSSRLPTPPKVEGLGIQVNS